MRIRQRTLQNGLRCAAIDIPHMRVFGISLWFRVGQVHGGIEHPQAAHLLEHLTMRGPDGNAAQFADRLEACGAIFNGCVHRSWMAFTGRVPFPGLYSSLYTLRDIVFGQVDWTDEHVAVERDVIAAELELHMRGFSKRFPGEAKSLLAPRSPYTVPFQEQIQSVQRVTLHQLLAFRSRFMVPANAVFLICGSQACEWLDSAASMLEAIPGGVPAEEPGVSMPGGFRRAHLRVKDHLHAAAVAFRGPGYRSNDTIPMGVGYRLLATGMGARLYRSLVLEQGLAYQIHLDKELWERDGTIVFFAQFRDAEGPARFLHDIEHAVRDMAAGRVTAEELHRAKHRLCTKMDLEAEHPEEIIRRQGPHLLYRGIPFDLQETMATIESLTHQDLAGCWGRYLDWSNAVTITTHCGEERA